MKKLFMVIMVLFVAVVISACKKDKPGKFDYADGKYFAIQDVEDLKKPEDYRYWTVVTIKNKKITDVEWNAYHIAGGAAKCQGDDKYQCSVDGVYAMGGKEGEWHEQADETTKWIVKNQKIGKDLTFTNGKTDAISSVSITVEELFDLIDEALKGQPVAKGNFKEDGFFYYESGRDETNKTTYKYVKSDAQGNKPTGDFEFEEGEFVGYTFGSFIIVNGTLVVADFNAVYTLFDFLMNEDNTFDTVTVDSKQVKVVKVKEDGTPTIKYLTKDPAKLNYGMRKDGGEWYVQADKVEAKLLADQALTITVDGENGTVDGVTGVSMGHTVAAFKDIYDKLIADAK